MLPRRLQLLRQLLRLMLLPFILRHISCTLLWLRAPILWGECCCCCEGWCCCTLRLRQPPSLLRLLLLCLRLQLAHCCLHLPWQPQLIRRPGRALEPVLLRAARPGVACCVAHAAAQHRALVCGVARLMALPAVW